MEIEKIKFLTEEVLKMRNPELSSEVLHYRVDDFCTENESTFLLKVVEYKFQAQDSEIGTNLKAMSQRIEELEDKEFLAFLGKLNVFQTGMLYLIASKGLQERIENNTPIRNYRYVLSDAYIIVTQLTLSDQILKWEICKIIEALN